MIPFGPWLPDRPKLENPGLVNATNVIPTAGGYEPFQGGTAVTDALDDPCQGAASFKQTDGTSYVFAGDESKLYQLRNAVWDDVSSKTYAVSIFNQWRYAQFGTLVLAANGSDRIQKVRTGTTANFEEIPASPVCQFMAVVRDFLVVGPVEIGGDRFVQWSATNDVDSWTPTVNSSGIQVLIEGGPLKGITGGDFGTVLQESTVTRMNFVGGDLVFSFDIIENAKGCLVAGSIIQLGAVTYYWSEEGIERFGGTNTTNIGEGQVNKTLFDRLNFDALHKVTAAIDPERRLVIWAYPTTSDTVDRLLIYHVGENRFSDVELTVQVLVAARDVTISIDDIAGSIDDSPLTGFPTVTSLDDPLLLGGRRRLSAFNSSNVMETLDGSNLAATLTMGEFIFSSIGKFISDGKKVHTRRLRGAVDGAHTISILHRSKLQSAQVEEGPTAPQDDGSVAINVNDRYQAFQLETAAAATWEFAQGIDFEEVTKGGR